MTGSGLGWRSAEERAARGRAERSTVPREAHAELVPTHHDAVDLVLSQEEDRIQDLLSIRHGRMLASPFAFYRGSARQLAYAEICAQTLARAHARSGDRIAIAAYLGGRDVFDQAVADFAAVYADKAKADFAALERAAAAGRPDAEYDV